MRIEVNLPSEDLSAIDEMAAQAGTTRDRVIHWAVAGYFHTEDRAGRARAMAEHPAGKRFERRRSA